MIHNYCNTSGLKALLGTLALVAMTGCTEVEPCQEPHPHTTHVDISFDWGSQPDSLLLPATMDVFADRIIAAWKWQRRALPAHETTRIEARIDTVYTEADTTVSVNTPDMLRQGSYKFVALSRNDRVFSYDRWQAVADSEAVRHNFGLQRLDYRPITQAEAMAEAGARSFKDYNDYAPYVHADATPVCGDTLEILEVKAHETTAATFTPEPLTQRVVLAFGMRKLQTDSTHFVVDSIVGDIAGIPSVIYPYGRVVDVTHTYKMMQRVAVAAAAGGADTHANDSLHCTMTVDVAGLVVGASPHETSGPGIMQVSIYTTATDADGRQIHRRVMGKINLFYPLEAASLLHYGYKSPLAMQTRRYAYIEVGADVVLDAANLFENEDDNGIPRWVQSSTEVIHLE